MSFKGVWILFTVLILESAFAQLSPPSKSSSKQAAPKIEEIACGLKCKYQRANDQMIHETLYLVNKKEGIASALGHEDDKTKLDSALKAMGGVEFCGNQKQGSDDSLDIYKSYLDDCYKKYESFHQISLLNLREAIGKNEDIIAKLVSGRSKEGAVESSSKVVDFNEDEDVYIPDVLSVYDLKAQYKKGLMQDPTRLSKAKIENQKWISELVTPGKPSEQVEFKKVSKDGVSDVKESPIHMVTQDDKGQTKKDQKVSKYLQDHLNKPEVQSEIKKAKERLKGLKIETAKVNEEVDQFERQIIGKDGAAAEDTISAEAFAYARNMILYRLDEGKKTLVEDQEVDSEGHPISKTSGKLSRKEETQKDLTHEKKASAKPSNKTSSTNEVTGGAFKMKSKSELADLYKAETKFKKPTENQNSNYIRYDLDELLKDAGFVP